MSNVYIIGGGASGLTAAIFAAKRGHRVIVLEHRDRVGKKILMTGNGKCNLTNMSDFCGKYYSDDAVSLTKIYDTLVTFGAKDTRAFFESLGLYTKEKKDGAVYPVSEQASTVLDTLRSACAQFGVELVTDCEVHAILPRKRGGELRVTLSDENGKRKTLSFFYDKLIVAAGGAAAAKSGSDGSGYKLVKAIGHDIIKPLPALVQLKCDGSFFKSVSGVRAQVGLMLYIDGNAAAFEEGELQLTDYGISGIPVFQFSRLAAHALSERKSAAVSINFLPFVDKNDRALFVKKNTNMTVYGYKTVEELLSGMVHKKVAALVCKQSKVRVGTKASEAGAEVVSRCIYSLFDFRVTVTGTNPFENAQVCSGGVPLCEVDDNFASRLCSDVYIVGELLDCDGICGGYNLQWAWATGAIAGRNV